MCKIIASSTTCNARSRRNSDGMTDTRGVVEPFLVPDALIGVPNKFNMFYLHIGERKECVSADSFQRFKGEDEVSAQLCGLQDALRV